MRTKDTILLEQAYNQILLKEAKISSEQYLNLSPANQVRYVQGLELQPGNADGVQQMILPGLEDFMPNAPAQEVFDFNTRLRKLLYLFSDTDYKGISERLQTASDRGDEKNWEKALFDDPTVKQGSQEAYNVWKKEIMDVLNRAQ
jgi:hypothetical protein